jgi:MoaA/NifB/PqqE/SkfB family radical SAM enzyme
MLSNGHLIDEAALLANPPGKLLVNLGAASPGVFNALYPKLDPSRQEELEDKLLRLNIQVPMTLVMIITRLNYRDIPAYIRMASRFSNADVSFKPASLSADTSRLELDGAMKQEILKDLLPEAERLCLESGIRNDIPLLKARLTLEPGEFLVQKTGCYAGLLYSRIYSTGDVFYCCAHMKTGNALETPFQAIWSSPVYDSLRSALFNRQFLPQCRTCGKVNLNYSVSECLPGEDHG